LQGAAALSQGDFHSADEPAYSVVEPRNDESRNHAAQGQTNEIQQGLDDAGAVERQEIYRPMGFPVLRFTKPRKEQVGSGEQAPCQKIYGGKYFSERSGADSLDFVSHDFLGGVHR